ncbi:MAG: hypothetical protein ICV87_02860 [Gemmatimonadetes bacterium]|nr:hypothetical protein [Gemmatimonadota bacterium]
MRRLAVAPLFLAACATARTELPPSDRGFATDRSLECARTLLEARGYDVEHPPRRAQVRGGKAFTSRGSDVVIHVIVTARLEPSVDRRATLRMLTSRRVVASNPDAPRDRTGRLSPSAYFEAAQVSDDVRAVIGECTLGGL